jgi:hypothetical protein
MLYREIIAVCSEIRTKHINTPCGENIEFLGAFLKSRRIRYVICYIVSITSALDAVGGQRHSPVAFYSRERLGPHCIGGWLAPRAVWAGTKILASTGFRSPDRPAHSESLYRLSYPGPHEKLVRQIMTFVYF